MNNNKCSTQLFLFDRELPLYQRHKYRLETVSLCNFSPHEIWVSSNSAYLINQLLLLLSVLLLVYTYHTSCENTLIYHLNKK